MELSLVLYMGSQKKIENVLGHKPAGLVLVYQSSFITACVLWYYLINVEYLSTLTS